MLNKIIISRPATNMLETFSNKSGIRQNIIARNVLMQSLESNDFFISGKNIKTSGKEFNTYTLFGEQYDLYMMFIKQKYHLYQDLDNMLSLIVAWHIEEGLKDYFA